MDKLKTYGGHLLAYGGSIIAILAAHPEVLPPDLLQYAGVAGLVLTALANAHAAGVKLPGAASVAPKMLALFAVSVLVVTTLSACQVLTPTQSIAQQVAIQYATAKFIEDKHADTDRAKRAADVIKAAEAVKAFASGETVTIATLQAKGLELVAGSNLGLADKALANTLVVVVVQELQSRVNAGVLSDDDRIKVVTVLDSIIAAANAYVSHPA